MKVPTAMSRKCPAGNTWPISAEPPSSEERGTISPEYWMVGSVVMITVPRIAAICVRVKAEISRPRLVVAST